MGMGVQGVFRHICVADVDIEIFILAGCSCRPWEVFETCVFYAKQEYGQSSA